jgi:DNA polymerase-3 subunit gamma/tau
VEQLFKKHAGLASDLHDCVGLVAYAPPFIEMRLMRPLSANFGRDLGEALKGLTGFNWTVKLGDGPAQPTLMEQERFAKQAREDAVWSSPVGEAIREAFPDAELLGIEALKNGSVSA